METCAKLDVLARVAAALNARRITWAVSGSLLLYLKGIAPLFHDIDLLVREADVEQAKAALLELGAPQPAHPDPRYTTRHFLEFSVMGVDVDLMAGFAVMSGGREFYSPLEPNSVCGLAMVRGVPIPLQSVQELRTFYERMGRAEKTAMIDAYTDTRGAKAPAEQTPGG